MRVCHQPVTAEFWLNFNRPASSSLVSRDHEAVHRSMLVLRLDDVYPLEQLSWLDYVKIDIEGAEVQVLAGANETLRKFRPILQLEPDHFDAPLNLPDYSAYQAPGGPNKVCIPSENPRCETALQLGWTKISWVYATERKRMGRAGDAGHWPPITRGTMQMMSDST